MAKQLLDQEKILFKENDLDLIAATNPEAYQVSFDFTTVLT